MKIRNELALPEPIVTAVRSDGYDKGECEFSTTELIGPPRIAVLKRQWHEHLSEDVSDRIFALLGKSIHTILEHSAGGKRYIVEKRFFVEHDGYRIGGQIDLFDIKESTLSDWKLTSYHTVGDATRKYPWSSMRTVPADKDWAAQGNINRYLMFRNGYKVKAIQYVAIFRDFSRMKAMRDSEHPQRQVEVLRIPIWPHSVTEDYLSERIKLHVAARTELPLCSPEERWMKPATFAVTKAGNKRATRLLPTEKEAQALAADLSTHKVHYTVEPRPSESVRCLYYCPVSGYCSFGRALIQEKQEAA